jgi:hypothetical protein
METKIKIAVKSAFRAILPTVALLILLYESGEVKNLHDLFTVPVLSSLFAALGVKGVASYVTAKDVTVK